MKVRYRCKGCKRTLLEYESALQDRRCRCGIVMERLGPESVDYRREGGSVLFRGSRRARTWVSLSYKAKTAVL